MALRAYAQGRLLEAQGDLRDALAEYYRALVQDPRSLHLARHVTELASQLGQTEAALDLADRALRIDPSDPRSLWLKGSTLFYLGRPEEALDLVEKAVAADSSELEYVQTLGRIAEQLDRIDVVERAYSRAVVLDEDEGESWFQLAAAQARLGRFDEADRSLGRAKELSPLRPGQLFLQGWIDESLGRTEEAIVVYRQHLDMHPADDATRRRLVPLLARTGRWREAHEEARRVSRANPADTEALEVEADLAFRAKRPKEGTAAVARLVQLADPDPLRVMRAAAILARHGRESDAIRIADAWVGRHPDDVRGILMGARVRALAGRTTEAIEMARRAVRAAPDSLAPRRLLAGLYQDQRRFDEAEQVLVEARLSFADHLGLTLDLAACREERGDIQGAEAAAREALRIEPGSTQAQNFLGYLLADQNRLLDEAESLIREAVAREPDNGAIVDSMGWVYYRLGRLAEAREQLERAVRLTGGNPTVREHLGDVYRDLGLFAQAREQYRLSLGADARNPRVRAKLAALPK